VAFLRERSWLTHPPATAGGTDLFQVTLLIAVDLRYAPAQSVPPAVAGGCVSQYESKVSHARAQKSPLGGDSQNNIRVLRDFPKAHSLHLAIREA